MSLEFYSTISNSNLGVYISVKTFCSLISKTKPFSVSSCYSFIDDETIVSVKIGSKIIIKTTEIYSFLLNTPSTLDFKEDWKKTAHLSLGKNATPKAIAKYLGISVDLIHKMISKKLLLPIQEKNPNNGSITRTVIKVSSMVNVMVCPWEATLIEREKVRKGKV